MADPRSQNIDAFRDFTRGKPSVVTHVGKTNSMPLVDLRLKIGSKHSADDMAQFQVAHDALAKLGGGIHCAMISEQQHAENAGAEQSSSNPNEQQDDERYGTMGTDVGKVGMKHSAATMDMIKTAHDAIHECSGCCPGAVMKDDM